jgi:hypothetical protein
MRFSKLTRLFGALCLAGSVTYVAAAPANASGPNWRATIDPLPAMVHNGADAGYQITITNGGTSNISQLYLVGSGAPTFVGGPDGAACTGPGVTLKCTFGALSGNPPSSVTIIVAYKTPASGNSFSQAFEANTTGVSLNDKHHTSHGDTLDFTGSSVLTLDKNYGGGFDKDKSTVGTDASLGKNNIQSTQLTPPVIGVIATVQDGLGDDSFTCTPTCTKTLFGEWSKVTVGSGGTYLDANGDQILFSVSLMVYGKSLPTGVTADSIQLVHVLDSGAVDILSEPCGATPTLNCLTVTKVGSNFKITGWVDQNGGFKGMG